MSLLGRYQLQDLLGQGGMGAVYRALDTGTREIVAVKLLHADSGHAKERMLREIRALSSLDHPGIVSVRDTGTHDGSPFVVLDFIQGETLAERVNRGGPYSSYDATELARDLADALAHAHRQGVVHRDVKPDNVLLDAGSTPRLTDFGLSTQASEEQQRLTVSGALMGTPGFLSPEQAQGQRDRVGPLSDVYGLGAVLYFALTGRAPINGHSLPEVIAATCYKQPKPPHEEDPTINRALSDVCMRCLAKDPEARYRDASELSQALDDVLSGPAPRTSAAWLAALGLLVAAGAIGLGWALGRMQTAPNPKPAPPPPPAMRPPPPSSPPPEEPLPQPPASADSITLLRLCDRINQALEDEAFEDAQRLGEEATTLAPNSARSWFHRGIVAMDMTKPKEALYCFVRASEIEPERASILLNRGLCLSALKRYEESLPYLNRALEAEDEPIGRVHRARALLELGDPQRAEDDMSFAIDMPALIADDLFNLLSLLKRHSTPSLVSRAHKRLAAFPLRTRAERFARAELLQLTLPEVTLRDTQLLLKEHPDHTGLRVLRARALLHLGKPQAALDSVHGIPLDSVDHTNAVELTAFALYYLGRPDEALLRWESLLESSSKNARVQAALTLIRLERHEEAEALLQPQFAGQPADIGLRSLLHTLRGEHARALELARELKAKGFMEPWLLASVADSLEHEGDASQALLVWTNLVDVPRLFPAVRAHARERIAVLGAE